MVSKKEVKKEVDVKEPDMFSEYEINIIDKNDIVYTIYRPFKDKTFKYKNITYNVDNEKSFLFPTESGYIPVLYYNENKKDPIDFKDKNKGIPARALHLLWNHSLYSVIVTYESDRTNKLIIIILLAGLILFGIRMYFAYGSG